MTTPKKKEPGVSEKINRYLRRRELRQARKHNQWLEAHKPRMVAAEWQGGASTTFQFILPEETDVPVTGSIIAYGGASAPTGYLLCDGTAVSRVTYGTLFSIIGTAYGAGDGSTTFNLPDLGGRSPYGVGTNVDMNARGNSDGLVSGSRTPNHQHNAPSHTHPQNFVNDGNNGNAAGARINFGGNTLEGGVMVTSTGGGGNWSAEAGVGAPAAPGVTSTYKVPWVVVNYIIKT